MSKHVLLTHSLAIASAAALVSVGLVAAPAQARPAPLTTLAHLDFLLDDVQLPAASGHTTYGDGAVELPWTYADHHDDGSYTRVGGGTYDAATDTYGQGAFNSDDVAERAREGTR